MTSFISSLRRALGKTAKTLPQRLSIPAHKDAISLVLEQAGLAKVGAGSFGRVHANKHLAVKMVITRESPGYLAYARYCRKHANTNLLLPKVFCLVTVGRFTLVFMEALISKDEQAKTLSRSLRRVSRTQGLARVNEVSRLIGRKPASLAAAVGKLEAILKNHPRSFWDLRGDNLLFRRERGALRMVLADPLAW